MPLKILNLITITNLSTSKFKPFTFCYKVLRGGFRESISKP